jgi:Tfp pilus assembly protein PilX
MNKRPDRDDEAAPDRRTAALIGLVVILVLAILGVVLVRELGQQSKLEDCLMSGRTNCAPIEVPSHR